MAHGIRMSSSPQPTTKGSGKRMPISVPSFMPFGYGAQKIYTTGVGRMPLPVPSMALNSMGTCGKGSRPMSPPPPRRASQFQAVPSRVVAPSPAGHGVGPYGNGSRNMQPPPPRRGRSSQVVLEPWPSAAGGEAIQPLPSVRVPSSAAPVASAGYPVDRIQAVPSMQPVWRSPATGAAAWDSSHTSGVTPKRGAARRQSIWEEWAEENPTLAAETVHCSCSRCVNQHGNAKEECDIPANARISVNEYYTRCYDVEGTGMLVAICGNCSARYFYRRDHVGGRVWWNPKVLRQRGSNKWWCCAKQCQ